MEAFAIKSLPVTEQSKQIAKILRYKRLPVIGKYYRHKLDDILKNNGENIKYSRDFYCRYGNIYGNNVDLSDTFCLDYDKIFIGDNTSFSYQNMILTSTHDFNDFNTVITKPVIIGKNCWITSRVIILPGVTIGDNVVIGAGSVVTKDIPSNVFAAGNPAKIIKKLSPKGS